MPILSDYHIHTTRCKHALGEMEAYVEQAIRLGLREIAFTDHIPLPYDFDIEHRMDRDELDGYVQSISDLNDAYPEISILTGIEADYYEGFESYTEDLLSQYPFDIVLMAVHFIRHWPEGNWVFHYDFPEKSIQEVYADYLNMLAEGIKTGLFDVVAHLDLIKAPNQPLIEYNERELRELFRLINRMGMAVEINTSGKRKTINEFYPSPTMWPLLEEENVPVTVGSDSHSPVQVGFHFETLEKQLNIQPVRIQKRTLIRDPLFASEFGEI